MNWLPHEVMGVPAGMIPAMVTPRLLPELQAAVHTYHDSGMTWIKHKFVNDWLFPTMEERYNKQYHYKVEAAAEALASGKWHTFVFLHERPWRREALLEIADLMTDVEYWSLFRDVWVDSENIPEFAAEWTEMLSSGRPRQEAMMTGPEVEALAALSEIVVIYQGHTDVRDDGWSWTTLLSTATWFAKRFARLERADEGIVTTAYVERDKIAAYLLGRGEFEVLVDPEALTHVTWNVVYERDEGDEDV